MKEFGICFNVGNLYASPLKIEDDLLYFRVWSTPYGKTHFVEVYINKDSIIVTSPWKGSNVVENVSNKQLFILMLQFGDEFLEIEKRSEQEYNLIYEKLSIESLLNDSQITRKRKTELKKCLDNIEFELLYYTDIDFKEAIDEVNRIAPSVVLA